MNVRNFLRDFGERVSGGLNNLRPSVVLEHFTDGQNEANREMMFHSARLKLTIFYLIVVIVLSLLLTLSVLLFAGYEVSREGRGEVSQVRHLFSETYSVAPRSPKLFSRYQSNQLATLHRRLDRDVLIINVVTIILGGLVSYWYAGRTLQPIEEAHEAQARFASDASHELRTPLAALKVENEVFLRQKEYTKKEAQQQITSNLEEVERLEQLVNNLLALHQYEHNQLQLKRLHIDEILTLAREQAMRQAEMKDINIVTNADKKLILGHKESVLQLLSIITENAIKYSPEHTTIFIDGIAQEKMYHVSIRDQGGGISEQDLPHIFERLYRGDKSRTGSSSGFGLGLSLAKEITRANQAQIAVRNYPNGGAQFVVSFNLAQ